LTTIDGSIQAYPPSEDDALVPLSALQHYLYCPRQCALIHLDQIWTENVFTAEGRLLHEKADSGKAEKRGDVKSATGLLLCSRELGLTGKADVVEFHRKADVWLPYPVEYKRGRPKAHSADKVQLCAQALCLEEMLGLSIPEGALFYGKTRRRQVVPFDDALRGEVRRVALAVHEQLHQKLTPPPVANERCVGCSLTEDCLPKAIGRRSASSYVESLREME
jgi:CRISPR-associated exonuclease Cas4